MRTNVERALLPVAGLGGVGVQYGCAAGCRNGQECPFYGLLSLGW